MHAFASDEQSLAKGRNRLEEGIGVGRQIASEDDTPVAIEDDKKKIPGVQIDACIKLGSGWWNEGTHG
jgi:hypothetical protein